MRYGTHHAFEVQTAPTVEPITTPEAKAHLRVDASDEDAYIGTLVQMAREALEEMTGRAFITQTLDLWLDHWPHGSVIHLPRSPVQSVTSVVYYDESGNESTLAASSYVVDEVSEPGRVVLDSGSTWPTATLRAAKGVRVRYVAGYGGTGSTVPADIKHAMKWMVAHAYERREPTVTGTIIAEMPMTLRSSIWRHRTTMLGTYI